VYRERHLNIFISVVIFNCTRCNVTIVAVASRCIVKGDTVRTYNSTCYGISCTVYRWFAVTVRAGCDVKLWISSDRYRGSYNIGLLLSSVVRIVTHFNRTVDKFSTGSRTISGYRQAFPVTVRVTEVS
jgi:hypothetical protein